MRRSMRVVAGALVLATSVVAAWAEQGSTTDTTKPNEQAPKLSPAQREEAKANLDAKLTEARELQDRATEVTKAIGELASSGKLPQDQQALDQMRKMVDELSAIKSRMQAIEEEVQAMKAWIDGQREKLPAMAKDVDRLKRYKWGNYVQFQYVDTDRTNISGGNQTPIYDSFRMRRVRLGLTHTIDPRTTFKVSFDLATNNTGTPTDSGAQLRDAFLTYDLEADNPQVSEAILGRQPVPLGYEIVRSSAEREFPERAVYNQTLFNGERSTGVVVRKELAKNTVAHLGTMNALTINDPQQRAIQGSPGNRLGVVGGLRHTGGNYDVGVSGFVGKRHSQATTSGSTTVTNETIDRRFIYVDGTYNGLFDPRLFIRAEAMFGQDRLNQTGEISATATADNEERDLTGHQIQLGYNLNARNQVNLRYEQFDRDVDRDGDALRGYGLAYIHYLNPNTRLTAAHEIFEDPLRAFRKRYQVTTLRVQFRL